MADVSWAHGFVFAKHLDRMAEFYTQAFGWSVHATADSGFVFVGPAGSRPALALHALPPHVAEDIDVESPPKLRDETFYKLCFSTDDLEATRDAILTHGGRAQTPWEWGGRRYCECSDPEGNVIQIFQPNA